MAAYMPYMPYLLILPVLFGAMAVAAFLVFFERRLLSVWQDRHGPNRAGGPFGILQALADVIKLLTKHDWVPPFADKIAFVVAPCLSATAILLAFVVLPIAPGLQILDINIGLLFFLGMTSIAVYGVLLGGFASNNKYSLLGALRSAAQMITYEVFMGLSVMGVVMQTGSFRLSDIVRAQEHLWFVVPQLLGFGVFLLASVAEAHRAPFDLPEAEQELTAGFHTEYSGMKFGLVMVGEYLSMILNSAMIVTLFFGGWLGPSFYPGALSGFVWFALKTFFFICFYILLRATLARPRYDQLMSFGWQVLLPIVLLNLVVTGGVMLIWGQ